MTSCKIGVLICVVAFVTSSAKGQYPNDGSHPGLPYDFTWTVNEPEFGNDFGHKEQSNGNAVQGQYYVLLPDGRRQTVSYTVDGPSGYIADVQYDGEARYPTRGSTGGGVGGGYN